MLITMTILIFVQVFTRYVMSDTVTWTEEASRYIFIWLIFLSIGVSFNEEKHISITILKDRLSDLQQKMMQQVVYTLVFLLSILMVYQGFVLIEKMIKLGQHSASLGAPMWLVYLSLPVGFLLTILRLIQNSINLWKDKENGV